MPPRCATCRRACVCPNRQSRVRHSTSIARPPRGSARTVKSIVAGGGGVNPTPLVGVNATADTTNRLAVSSPASLFNHEGAGRQLKVNRDGERQHHHRFERRCFRFVEHRHPGTGRYRADADQLVGPHYVPRCGSAQVLHRCDCAERECRRRRGHDLRHRRDWRCSARIF